MTIVVKRVGRFEFVIRILFLSILLTALEYCLPGNALLRFGLLSSFLYAALGVIVLGFTGLALFKVIHGRVIDANLPRWSTHLALAAWLFSTAVPIIWPHEWPSALILFFSLLIAGGLVRSSPVHPVSTASIGAAPRGVKTTRPRRVFEFPAKLLVSRLGFARTLVTIGCCFLSVIWLWKSGGPVGKWVAFFCSAILGLVWLMKVWGRLEDAGHMPRARHGFSVVLALVLVRLLRLVETKRHSASWYGFPFSNLSSMAPAWTRLSQSLNGYEILALLLLIQTPLAFLPSARGHEERQQKELRTARVNELAVTGPLEFPRVLLIIACAWCLLIYGDHVSGGGVGTWLARIGYGIVAFAWLVFAQGRLQDAGWAHDWYPSQYCLVVSVASLMPLAAGWVNSYEAALIFVLIQTPTVFLRSKSGQSSSSPEVFEKESS